MLNIVMLIGRLTADPDLNYGKGEGIAIGKFTLAVDDGFGEKKDTDFIRVTTFRKTAENVCEYLQKGSLVSVVGKWKSGKYEKDGTTHYTNELVGDRVVFLDKKGAQSQDEEDDQEEDVRDEDVPF